MPNEIIIQTQPKAGYETSTIETLYTQALAYSGSNVEYVGLAKPGSSKAAAVWQIRKLTYSGSNVTDVQFASGNANFDKIWNSRTGYSYS